MVWYARLHLMLYLLCVWAFLFGVKSKLAGDVRQIKKFRGKVV